MRFAKTSIRSCWLLVAAPAAVGCDRNETRTEQETAAIAATVKEQAPEQSDSSTDNPAMSSMRVAGVADCHPTAAVGSMLSRIVDLSDANSDGTISQEEAHATANFFVGGFFFRADSDGDGTITPEEGREARRQLMTQYPALSTLLGQAKTIAGRKPLAALAELVDIEYGKPVTVDEMRQAARGAVVNLYRSADQNGDGRLTPAEARAASWEGARALGQLTFAATDKDGSGEVTIEEFRAAMEAPTGVAFRLADADKNGRLSRDEAAVATAGLIQRFGVPLPREPSASN